MAAIVLAAAATGIASSFGAGTFIAGIAGSIGAFAGGFIDRAVFSKNPKLGHEGSRLADLSVQVSSYGKVIPIVYGSVRIAGNVIWSRPLQEHVNVSRERHGGKGGGGVTSTTTTYSYTVSLAIGICEGPITEVVRAWADSKLLDLSSGSYTLYLGSEAQLPDAYISSFEVTPAYRGLAYVVIRDFPLSDYGNRIPNFTFEVRKAAKKPRDLEDKITDIVFIPGAGEYVYDTQIQEKIIGVKGVDGRLLQQGKRQPVNMHTLKNKANVLVALDQLKTQLPSIEWVSVVINWFATSLDLDSLKIRPGVEFNDAKTLITPDEWMVRSDVRASAHQISRFGNGAITYGGTPTDKSVVRLLEELKRRGYKVMLYPMLQVDTINPPKPWRGRLTPKSVESIKSFFTKTDGYNNFISHYANLCNGLLDGLMIGSEFRGITEYRDKNNIYPATDELRNLAAIIKGIVGSKVKISYGADWSEYHSTNGWFHLDDLWADHNIDMVAIDCYVPLTEDLPEREIDYQKVYDGWTRGEGWDYYYSDGDRRKKQKYTSPAYAWKNIRYWWENFHVNPDGKKTKWQPKMKPLWLTELGFPSVDACSNQPNVFVDPESTESYYPRRSEKRVSFISQRTALNASLDFLEDQNKLDADFIPRRFIWTWDARPYPYFPAFKEVWRDGPNWKTGHWIQGKLGLSSLAEIIIDLLKKVGYGHELIDVSRLTDTVTGFVISSRTTVRSQLEILAAAYFFEMVESNGVLKFIKLGQEFSTQIIRNSDLIVDDQGNNLKITRLPEAELPKQIEVIYLDSEKDYQTGTVSSARSSVSTLEKNIINLPLSLSEALAQKIAYSTLKLLWQNQLQYEFTLPPRYASLEPTDLVTLNDANLRIKSAKLIRSGEQMISAVRDEAVPKFDEQVLGIGNFAAEKTLPQIKLELLDLPALEEDCLMYVAALSLNEAWREVHLYGADNIDGEWAFLKTISLQATYGAIASVMPGGVSYTFDRETEVKVVLINGELSSKSKAATLNGGNLCLIGDEVVQFQMAKLISTSTYILSNLLRGRFGTIAVPHSSGERFILLGSALSKLKMPISSVNVPRKYKAVVAGASLQSAEPIEFTYRAISFKPYAPCHIKGSRDSHGDLNISWIRRSRVDTTWRDSVDALQGEEMLAYEIEIIDAGVIKRVLTTNLSQVTYSSAEQLYDFGKLPEQITVKVYQLSAIVGRGYNATETISL